MNHQNLRQKLVDPQYEPVQTASTIKGIYTAILGAVIIFAPRFGLAFTDAEIGALLGLWVVFDFVLARWVRRSVWPDERIQNEMLDAETVIHGGP